MISITRILCPVDFSEASRHALECAAAVARWYEARLTVVHATGVPVGVPVAVQAGPVVPEPLELSELRRTEIRRSLEEFVGPVVTSGLAVDVQVADGFAQDEIPERARRDGVDLIVMGTHGRKGLQRLVLGSVTEKVLRAAPCPVMIVPPRAAGVHAPGFKRILCAVDLSSGSIEGLRHAASLAEETDASLLVLHVVSEDADTYAFEDPLVRKPATPEELLADAQERLATLVRPEVRDFCTLVEVVAAGKPAPEILRQAAEHDIDLIVLGVAPRTATEIALFGSTTQSVIREARCPVLTVPER